MALEVTFWGVRGSIACPGPDYLAFGGNTACVEVRADDERIILDAGTGLRVLGLQMLREAHAPATILLSHTHWDHISGFPFFQPAFHPDFAFHIMAGHLQAPLTIANVLAGQMSHPFFPVPIQNMAARLSFEDFHAGETIRTRTGRPVRTVALNHPDGATGYRVDAGGASVCYITDTEHVPGRPDEAILALVEGADLMIYDSTYTDEEFARYQGWGHSTWQEGVRLAQAAGVKQLALFHHSHERSDTELDAISRTARETWDGVRVVRDGMTLTLAP